MLLTWIKNSHIVCISINGCIIYVTLLETRVAMLLVFTSISVPILRQSLSLFDSFLCTFFFNNCVLFRSNSSNTAQKKQYQRRWDYIEIHKYASVAPTSWSLTQTEKLFFKTYTDFCNTHIRNKEIKVCADDLHKPISETNRGRRHTFV